MGCPPGPARRCPPITSGTKALAGRIVIFAALLAPCRIAGSGIMMPPGVLSSASIRVSVGSDEGGMSADDLDATLGKRPRDRLGDGADQLLFAVDQSRPVELWLAQFDAMDLGPRDLIQ